MIPILPILTGVAVGVLMSMLETKDTKNEQENSTNSDDRGGNASVDQQGTGNLEHYRKGLNNASQENDYNSGDDDASVCVPEKSGTSTQQSINEEVNNNEQS